MAKREVSSRYAGSLLGILWTFIQPAVMLFALWAIFGLGFRVQPRNDVPFIAWLAAGMAAWFLFADIINGAAGTIVSHAHLVKKHFFHPQILPIITISSCLITHAVFVLVLLILILFQNLPFNFYFLQFFYYLFCLVALSFGIGLAVSALNVFIRDVAHITRVIIQIGFWLTPVFWDISMLPAKYQIWIKLNPMYYIVQGYRDSFIYSTPFWEHPYLTLYFWALCTICLGAGAETFKKLKNQFVDVL